MSEPESNSESREKAVLNDALLSKLIELRKVAREAQQVAILDGSVDAVIVELDPVVAGSHAALKRLGVGFMDYLPNAES